ncbi:MAG TPA: ROK family protein [Planosporangium sp.]|nr:ROK family protein [Planosporangium sp.]
MATPATPATPATDAVGSVAGVDLGGTKVRAALADLTGRIMAEDVVSTDPRGGTAVAEQIVTLIRSLASRAGVDWTDIRATAVGSPGVPDPETGAIDLSPNISSFDSLDLRRELAERLGHPVVLDNDVNLAAFGEQRMGSGREHRDFVFVAVGTGIGMGIVVNGELCRGARGAAGEISYLPIGADPFDPANQVRGALEEAVAGATIAQRYEEATGERVSVPVVFERAGAGDEHALAAIEDEARLIALAVAAVGAVLDPEAVVLGGGIGSRVEMLDPVRRWLTRLGTHAPAVKTSQLGHRAALIGAIAAARHEVVGVASHRTSPPIESTPGITTPGITEGITHE